MDKLHNCRHEISVWKKNNLPYGKDKIKELQRGLEEIQNDNTKTEDAVKEAIQKLKEAYNEDELYWQQKSRNLWNKMGDRNTKFYHAVTRQRRAQNRIVGLYDTHGAWVTKNTEVEKVATDYFRDLFNSVSTDECEAFLTEVPTLNTEYMNEKLITKATEEEVKRAIFMMHLEKAPEPDGMTALFYQQA